MKTSLFTCLLFMSSIFYASAQNGIIKGTILTQKGTPAKNVVVKLNHSQEIQVDSLGKYEFVNLIDKSYEVHAKHIGFTS